MSPFVRPEAEQLNGPEVQVHVCPPRAAFVESDAVTAYEVIALPLFAGAFHVTVAEAFPAVAVTAVGGSGTVAGVTAFDVAEDEEVPTPFVAVTVKR